LIMLFVCLFNCELTSIKFPELFWTISEQRHQ
jgi:hypothetical protein